MDIHVLPDVHAKDWASHQRTEGRLCLSSRSRVVAELAGPILHRIQTLLLRRIASHVYVLGGHVAVLQPVVCLWPWAAGVVSAEDAEQARIILLKEPDKAVAKHCVGSLNHLRFQGVERVEGLFDLS